MDDRWFRLGDHGRYPALTLPFLFIKLEVSMLKQLTMLAVALGVISTMVSSSVFSQDKQLGLPPADDKVTAAGKWGHLSGQIIVQGVVPKRVFEDVAGATEKDLATCLVDGKHPLDDGLVINEKNQLRDVFVSMYVRRDALSVPDKFHPSYVASKKKSVPIVIENCRISPHAIFARTGQTLAFTNKDDVGHSCAPITFHQEHSMNLPATSTAELVLTNQPDLVPGEIRCHTHKWMDAVIFVRDNPYVAISSETGEFRIENIPIGDWQFQFWHKKAGYLKTIELNGFETNRRGVIDGVRIENGKTLDLGILTLPVKAFDD